MLLKKFFLTLCVSLGMVSTALADEGMWLLSLIEKHNIKTMNKMGCRLTADQIYSVNHGSIKDAVIIFGGGCTGEIVSDQGLIFTNHHCGYSSIQQLSSVEHNYLHDGYWSRSFEEDLPVPGLQVRFLQSLVDVTDSVMVGVDNTLTPAERTKKIKDNMAHVKSVAEEKAKGQANGHIEVRVASFFDDNQFFLIRYKVFNDVRLVGTPPESIGKFGHDTDNWQWPRHTGDFSIFRVYADENNEPADYSASNKPYKPLYHLPISVSGMKPGDYAMTIGYPGSTDRYATSWGVNMTRDVLNASRIQPREIKQNIWFEDMMADQAIYIKYASKYARSTNYYKNSIGMNRGINNLNVVGRKQAEEADFQAWANQNGTKEQKKVLKQLKRLIAQVEPYAKASSYLSECLLRGPEIFNFAQKIRKAATDSATDKIIEQTRSFYKDYNVETDRKATQALLAFYYTHIDKAFHPKFFSEVENAQGFGPLINDLFANSLMADSTYLIAAAKKGNFKAIHDDKAAVYAKDIMKVYTDRIVGRSSAIKDKLSDAQRIYMAGRLSMNADKALYPNANFSCRLSYGTVGGYSTADTTYTYFTDLDGVMAKENPNSWEFNVAPKLKELYKAKDFGRYADADGKMHVCFITNNDITGGNSGSPVLNGKGELLGLAFDGNWEAMSGDIIFEPEVQRCICVDIRYVLFIIDKLGGAQNIIDELDLR